MLFRGLSAAQLEALADDVERGRVRASSGDARLDADLAQLRTHCEPLAVASTLRLLAAERREWTAQADRRIDLVWSGPERDGAGSRDTAVVARELFASAERDVLLSSYALHGGQELFAVLAERLAVRPHLRVRLCLNVIRGAGDTRDPGALVLDAAHRFRTAEWPGPIMPLTYYDPRSLALRSNQRAVLHAKCIVVDDARAFVTSANFTEAAHSRNIEAGVLVNDSHFARTLRLQFDDLIERGVLRKLMP